MDIGNGNGIGIGIGTFDNKLMIELQNIKCDDIDEFTLNNIKTVCKVVDIYDGDTCKIVLIIKNMLYKFNCRLLGLDTPEMKPSFKKINRELEISNAYKSRNRLIQLSTTCTIDIDSTMTKQDCKKMLDSNTKIITVFCHEFDKYGRLLISLYNNEENHVISYNDTLISEGFAKKYDGKHKDGFVF
jgi:endonuclease YncB( thermonuclease family)